MSLKIYHNPRCSKSRQTLALLTEHGHEPEIILYLETKPGAGEIKALATALGLESVRGMMRRGESVYKELELKTEENESKLVQAMAQNPILIERPIVVNGAKAAIGRPPEQVLAIV